MDTRPRIVDFVREGYRGFLPHLAVDCVIFGFHARELKILLLKWKHLGAWSLPGGYVRWEESLDEAAARVLFERTGLSRIFLEQFRAFGGTDRKEHTVASLYRGAGVDVPEDFWPVKRIVSIGYFALVDFSEVIATPDFLSDEASWWDVHDRPPLLFDHDEMVTSALQTLRGQLSYRPIGFNLLPEKFTMPELQRMYETILGRPLDRRNFQKKIHDLGLVERLSERKTGGAHRAPYLYRFNVGRYEEAAEEGVSFE